MNSSLKPTPWPGLPWLSAADMTTVRAQPGGDEELLKMFEAREQLIALAKAEPLTYGHEIEPGWTEARRILKAGCRDLLIMGGRRSGKTEFAAKVAVERLLARLGAEIQCWSQNETTSVDRQQTYLYRYLPAWMRKIKKLNHETRGLIKVSYSRATGFSDRVIVAGHNSVARCFTYQSYRNDPTIAEGAELDFCWLDEMAPVTLVNTLRFCLVSRGGTLLQTFTPEQGYTDTVAEYLNAATVEQWRTAELLPDVRVWNGPRGQMPYVIQSFQRTRKVVFFFTADNPFPPGNYGRLKEQLADAHQDTIMRRAYGWPTKRVGVAFPKFGAVNIVPAARVPGEGTNWLFLDPAGRKSPFLVWLRVDALGHVYAYREWPGIEFGEWAVAGESKRDGVPGPAQDALQGIGVDRLKRLILNLENGEAIFLREMDPRFGHATVASQDDADCLVDLFLKVTPANSEGPELPGMAWGTWPSTRTVNEAVEVAKPWFDWNEDAPVSPLNCPRFYVSEACQNLIYALKTWTSLDGEKGATKDPIDCLLGAAKRGVQDIQLAALGSRGGGSY